MNIALPAGGYRFGYVEYEIAAAFGPREQHALQLVYFFRGEALVTVDDTSYRVPPDHAILLFPQHEECFAFSTTDVTHHGWVERPFGETAQTAYAGTEPIIAPFSADLLAIARGGHLMAGHTLPGASEARDAAARFILEAFLVRSDVAYRAADLPAQLARVLAYIDDNWNSPIDLPDLARHGAVSETHLNRLFHRFRGTTAMRYLRRYRAERAHQLIVNTSLTLERIAERCGFANPFHLSRVIHQEFGEPPATLRAR